MASGGSWLLSTSRHCSAATKQIFIWTLQRICLAAVHEPTTNQYGTQVGSECVVFSRLSRSVRDQPRLLPGCNQITLPSSRILERRHEIAVSANNHGRRRTVLVSWATSYPPTPIHQHLNADMLICNILPAVSSTSDHRKLVAYDDIICVFVSQRFGSVSINTKHTAYSILYTAYTIIGT